MKPIAFSKEETKAIVGEIQRYFRDELDQDIGHLPAQLLLDFFSGQIGGYYYNRGLYDAHTAVTAKVDDLGEAILGLEQRPGGC
jgi:uncharacterized protein (DUF2164 family)